MKKIWVLLVRTSLPDKCYTPTDLVTTFSAFESFIDARNAMRETIKSFAFSENDMFDGCGRIINLDKHMDGMRDFDQPYEGELTIALLNRIYDALQAIINGENTILELEPGEYSDDKIAFVYDGEALSSKGVGIYRSEGYDPNIKTNAFSMEDEKDYYFYIDDFIGVDEDNASSELYIDLKQIDLK